MTIDQLPPAFVDRMRTLLGAEADAFFASYDQPARNGLRVNTLKLPPDAFRAISPWPLEPLPWCDAGFLISDEARPGKHPHHAAGLYYLQEPSAMAVADALALEPGQLVLDLAAAPGGKATQIASLLGRSGALIANEIVPSRVKPLGENLERWGAPNAILVNEEPARLAARLGPIFDRVLLDAPCSGEGMFRKAPVAIREWSPEHVGGSAARQAKILDEAARLVRSGGLLLYSTCTFAPDENEAQIARFLDRHPAWELMSIPERPGFASGRPEWSGSELPLERSIRLWPHHAPGEGHFLALLRNTGDHEPVEPAPEPPSTPSRSKGRAAPKSLAIPAWQRFVAESLDPTSDWLREALEQPERLLAQHDALYLRPTGAPDLSGLKVVRHGLPLGAAKPGRFEPAHALALAIARADARNVVDLSLPDAERYLAGEPHANPRPPGWTLVTIDSWPLGWGRRSNDTVKNHYPKGLRRAK